MKRIKGRLIEKKESQVDSKEWQVKKNGRQVDRKKERQIDEKEWKTGRYKKMKGRFLENKSRQVEKNAG